jgi:hypothetical protein
MKCYVVCYKPTRVSEEHTACFFKIEEQAKQEINMKHAKTEEAACFLLV